MIAKSIAIFDLDGTLVETDAANGAAYRRAMEEIGLRGLVGMCGRVTAETVRMAAGLCDDEMSAVVRAKVEAYCHELWRTRLGPAADALKCVLVNRAAFAKVVLLTDSSDRRAWETLAHWDLARHFDEIVCNGGRGDKYENYFGSCDSDPAACVVLAASYAKSDWGKDSGSRFAMSKAAEYGMPRYVIYDETRSGADPMFNLSREEVRDGATAIKPSEIERSSVLKSRSVASQLDLGL